MSIDDLKSERKAKRLLKDVSVVEVSYTSGNGAASGFNDALLFKSLDEVEDNSTDSKGKVVKSSQSKDPSSTSPRLSGDGSGDDNINDKIGENTDMSEELKKELDDLKHELAISKAEKVVAKYELGEDEVGLAKALAELSQEHQAEVLKSLDTLVTRLEEKEAEVAKAADPENPLKKELDQEEGHDEPDTSVEKTFKEQVAEAAESELKKGAK